VAATPGKVNFRHLPMTDTDTIFAACPTWAHRSRSHAVSQGSAGNVIAALCSFFIPGLGQLVQGRVFWAFAWFGMACFAALITAILTLFFWPFGWGLVSILSCVHAAVYSPRATA
jgi:TM2 domain-containing membrane protein YozV